MEQEYSYPDNLPYEEMPAGDDYAEFNEKFQDLTATLDDYFTTGDVPAPIEEGLAMDNVPSYLMPTVSSTLPPYQHGEVERIRNSYSTGSCWTIKKLPNKLEPGTVQSIRKKHTVENLILTEKYNFKPSTRLRDFAFHPHTHITMNYEKASYINKHAVDAEKVRTDSYSRKPFVVSSRIRFKFEDIFDNPNFVYPNMGPGGVKADIESLMRSDASKSAATVYEGKYNAAEGKLTHDTQLMIQDWSKRIYAALSRDWADLAFRIRFTRSQEVLVQFQRPELSSSAFPPPNNALLKYMQFFATHGIGMELKLQKRGDRWNILEYDPGHTASDTGETWKTENRPPSLLPSLTSQQSQQPSVDESKPADEEELTWFVRKSVSANAERPSADAHPLSSTLPNPSTLPLIPPFSLPSNPRMARGALETMVEERSQSSGGDMHSTSLQSNAGSQYLTFSFYAPWVTIRQHEINKKAADVDRAQAREYAEKRTRMYNPDKAKKLYGAGTTKQPLTAIEEQASSAGASILSQSFLPSSRVNSVNQNNLAINAALQGVRENFNAGGGSNRSSFISVNQSNASAGLIMLSRQSMMQQQQGSGSSAQPASRHLSKVFNNIDLENRS